MDFNINEHVRVKLTDHGRKALERQHVEFWAATGRPAPYAYRAPKEDAEGWSQWQLHRLMEQLGHLCVMSSPVPFETTIQLVQPKTWAPPAEDPMSAVRSMCG